MVYSQSADHMDRINVYATDDYTGQHTLAGWFDRDTAEVFGEATRWDGNNHVSIATGSQWNHEILYHTKGGRWVLHRWSQWQGSEPTYRFLSDDLAREWLLSNDHDDAVEQHFGPVESERGPGRPEIGKPVNIRFGDKTLEALDFRANQEGCSRAELARRIVVGEAAPLC